MHDPLTVAFEIRYPWRKYKKWPKGVTNFEQIPASEQSKYSPWWKDSYRDTLARIWHRDPCADGSDDSCDWFGNTRKLNAKEKAMGEAIWHLETILDNSPFYPDHEAHLRFQEVKKAMWDIKQRPKLRWHPRWHFHHWRLQVVPLQKLWRWLFSRCAICKKGFKWKEEVMGSWSGDRIWHFGCEQIQTAPKREDKES